MLLEDPDAGETARKFGSYEAGARLCPLVHRTIPTATRATPAGHAIHTGTRKARPRATRITPDPIKSQVFMDQASHQGPVATRARMHAQTGRLGEPRRAGPIDELASKPVRALSGD